MKFKENLTDHDSICLRWFRMEWSPQHSENIKLQTIFFSKCLWEKQGLKMSRWLSFHSFDDRDTQNLQLINKANFSLISPASKERRSFFGQQNGVRTLVNARSSVERFSYSLFSEIGTKTINSTLGLWQLQGTSEHKTTN